jgi:hypothetical protein
MLLLKAAAKTPGGLSVLLIGSDRWLASVSHERDAWFLDTSLSLGEIREHVGIDIKNHEEVDRYIGRT